MAFVSMVVVDGLLEKGLAYDTVAGFEPLAIHGDTSSDFDNILWRSDDRMLQPRLRPFLFRIVSPLGGLCDCVMFHSRCNFVERRWQSSIRKNGTSTGRLDAIFQPQRQYNLPGLAPPFSVGTAPCNNT